jgi:galactonate dehydratase
MIPRRRADIYSGGDRPSDVLEQAKVRKEQGFTRVKMNVSLIELDVGI